MTTPDGPHARPEKAEDPASGPTEEHRAAPTEEHRTAPTGKPAPGATPPSGGPATPGPDRRTTRYDQPTGYGPPAASG